MILLDANLPVYAHVGGMPQHQSARVWLDGKLSGRERVGMPWPSLLAFVRLVSNPRVFERPETVPAAWSQAEEWLSRPNVFVPQPTDRHAEVLGALLRDSSLRANLVPDADLAALAIEHGLLLCSSDGDFARFPGLRWQNPLAGA